MLQHGEILLEPSKQLWKKVFNTNPPKTKKALKEKDRIIFFLQQSFTKTWPDLRWSDYKLVREDKEIIKHLCKDSFLKLNYL